MLYTYIKCSKAKNKNISGPSFLRKHPEQSATGASGLHYATLRSDHQGIWTKKLPMNADKNHKEKMGYDLGSCTQETIMMLNPSTFPSQGWGTWQRFPLRTFQLLQPTIGIITSLFPVRVGMSAVGILFLFHYRILRVGGETLSF